MQLKTPTSHLLGGGLLTILGGEIFWRSAETVNDTPRYAAGLIAFLGVFVVGRTSPRLRVQLIVNLVFAALSAAYLCWAATRYPGIAKAGPEPSAGVLAVFFCKWFVILFITVSILSMITALPSLWRRLRRQSIR